MMESGHARLRAARQEPDEQAVIENDYVSLTELNDMRTSTCTEFPIT
jgi:hypothetical protein